MSHRALIVEDDQAIGQSIEDMLDSMSHAHVWVKNQYDAKAMLAKEDFSYVLLDLQIPANPGRGGADVQFGVNLLADIQVLKGPRKLPVIVMTGHFSEGLDLAAQLLSGGAFDIIAKPFTNKGRTLTEVIRKALETHGESSEGNDNTAPAEIQTQGFPGGALAVFEDRVEFLGETICRGRRCHNRRVVLALLAKRRDDKTFVCYSGDDLEAAAEKQGITGNSPGWIRGIRADLRAVLKKKQIACDPREIILSGEEGYRFNDRLSVQVVPQVAIRGIGDIGATTDARDVTNVTNRDVTDVPEQTPEQRANWILEEIGKGHPVTANRIAKKFGCGPRTAKRDLKALKSNDRIRFIGAAKTGRYQLVSEPSQV